MNILLVEDESAERALLEKHIRDLGHEVTPCSDEETALRIYQHTLYPVLILDLDRTGREGVKLCRHIRVSPGGHWTMILAILRSEEGNDIEAALNAGADYYLLKPVSAKKLAIHFTIFERRFREHTHRRRSEDSLRRQEDFLGHILESLPYPFYVIDPETYTVVMANSAAKFGVLSADSTCYALNHRGNAPCDEVEHPCPVRSVKKHPQPCMVEHLHYDQDGHARYAEVHAYPMFDQAGNLTQIIEYVIDITKRKQMEEALRESEAKWRSLTEHSPDIIIVVDADLNILFLNHVVAQDLSYEELLGTPIYNYVAEEEQSTIQETLKNVLETREPAIYETEYTNPDGSIISFETRAVPRIVRSNVVGLTLHSRISTERKRVEEELKYAKIEAESANNAKSDFLATMSHELRTPLNAILGYTQILKRDKSLTGKQYGAIETIHSSGNQLLLMINDLLDISKIEARKMELTLGAVAFPKFLKNIMDITRMRAQQKGLAFDPDIPSDLPASVQVDEQHLGQIILNLLSNAIKFTEKGRVTLRVKSEKLALNNKEAPSAFHSSLFTVHFEVKDTGIGIPPEHLRSLFAPFYQVTTTRLGGEGVGLGLAISQQLVQLMGSELHVKSTLGQGTTFWFDLELPEIEGSMVNEAMPSRHIIGFKGAKRTILLVDDKEKNRTMVRDILASLGFDLLEAIDGQDAVRKAQESHPALILMDLVMPVMDGFEATRQIRRISALKEVIVIGISASAFNTTKQESFAAGCQDFLVKPIHIDELLDCISRHLGLEWIYEDTLEIETTRPQLSKETPLIVPPQDMLRELLEFAQGGYIVDLRTFIARVKEVDPRFIPFVNRIEHFADNFQIDQIIELITSSIKETES